MLKENKKERIVRGMIDPVTEHLHEFRDLTANPATKESDIERWCQSFIKGCLGFSSSNGYSIRIQESKGKLRPDLIVCKGDKPICVVEVKKLGANLDKSDFRSGKIQLSQYLATLGNVRWGVLCNGHEWRLYDFSSSAASGVEVLSLDLHAEEDQIDLGKRAIEDLCWDFVEFHEASYDADSWDEFSKEATAFSPESLARAILSADVLKIITKAIRGEHEYKANSEVVADRVLELLSLGLDDSISGWNDVKQAELSKYIKSQKRSFRRSKKSSKHSSTTGAEVGELVHSESGDSGSNSGQNAA